MLHSKCFVQWNQREAMQQVLEDMPIPVILEVEFMLRTGMPL
jgi:hypothetical protein